MNMRHLGTKCTEFYLKMCILLKLSNNVFVLWGFLGLCLERLHDYSALIDKVFHVSFAGFGSLYLYLLILVWCYSFQPEFWTKLVWLKIDLTQGYINSLASVV